MKCKREYCNNEAKPIPDERYPDHVYDNFCSKNCRLDFHHQQEWKSYEKERFERERPARIEAKLDRIISFLEGMGKP